MVSQENKAEKEGVAWGMTKFKKGRELTCTNCLRFGSPLPPMRSGCRHIVFHKGKQTSQNKLIAHTYFELNTSVLFVRKLAYISF